MQELKDGEIYEMQGTGKKPYQIKRVGDVYSCSCPAWRNQSAGVIRTCKHIRKLRGDAAEEERINRKITDPVKNVKVKATAPNLLLANTYTEDIDPTGYYMSEKLDGVRALWDGKNFISRLGNIYHAPDWFKENLPKDVHLDGELWLGRKQFQKCVSIVRRQDMPDTWKDITYQVFDLPQSKLIFKDRYKELMYLWYETSFSTDNKLYWEFLPQVLCKDINHFQTVLTKIIEDGGEGLMLRDPNSLYPNSLYDVVRSNSLLKVKPHKDLEAEVIGYEPGKGKFKGLVGALIVKYNDKEFSVGSGLTDDDRKNAPVIGSKIVVKYNDMTDGGIPRHPVFLRLFEAV